MSAGALADLRPDPVLEVLRVNAVAPILVTQALAPLLAAAGTAIVVNLSSGLGSIAGATGRGNLAYGMSKAALNMLTRHLAAELAGQGTVVVSMSPGWVATDMGGASAPLEPAESVRGMLNVLDGLTPAQSGSFLDHTGAVALVIGPCSRTFSRPAERPTSIPPGARRRPASWPARRRRSPEPPTGWSVMATVANRRPSRRTTVAPERSSGPEVLGKELPDGGGDVEVAADGDFLVVVEHDLRVGDSVVGDVGTGITASGARVGVARSLSRAHSDQVGCHDTRAAGDRARRGSGRSDAGQDDDGALGPGGHGVEGVDSAGGGGHEGVAVGLGGLQVGPDAVEVAVQHGDAVLRLVEVGRVSARVACVSASEAFVSLRPAFVSARVAFVPTRAALVSSSVAFVSSRAAFVPARAAFAPRRAAIAWSRAVTAWSRRPTASSWALTAWSRAAWAAVARAMHSAAVALASVAAAAALAARASPGPVPGGRPRRRRSTPGPGPAPGPAPSWPR